MDPDADMREQMEAIQRALRRSGREMVLPGGQALVRGVFVLVACGFSYCLLGRPAWQMAVLWIAMVLLAVVVEVLLYLRLLAKRPDKFVTGMEKQMLKFLALTLGVGVSLTVALLWQGQGGLIAGLWMLLIGAAYVTVGLFSFSKTWVLGLCACVGGAVALFLPPGYSLAIGAFTLGGGSIAWAILLRARGQRFES